MWIVTFADESELEFDALPDAVQDGILARLILLEREGPVLGRPHADTLVGSRHANMKELRCNAAEGVWRIAFAFDPSRQAILLAGADKSGVGEKSFYRRLINKADKRFDRHLARTRR
ncbi:MAG: type II toxin-antitoxin system RelE/ParE family toxin [Beijerinckiaceae bacterium]